MVPQNAPWVTRFWKSYDGTIKTRPIRTAAATNISKAYNFSLKKYGSIKVTNRGKVENVSKPTATVDIWIDWKKVIQWMARMPPSKTRTPKSWIDLVRIGVFEKQRITPSVSVANNVLPQTITKGGSSSNFPNKPARPNRRTAMCISSKPCFLRAIILTLLSVSGNGVKGAISIFYKNIRILNILQDSDL